MKKTLILLLSTSLFLGGCYKTDFGICDGHETPGETQGTFNLILNDPSTEGESSFDNYTIYINGEEYQITDGVLDTNNTLDTGTYTVYIYNTPDDYEFTTSTEPESIIVTLPSTDGYIASNPGDLYFDSEDITISSGETTTITSDPTPITRELNLDLGLEGDNLERIESITITISGIASGWDLTNDEPYGDGGTVTITITDLSSESINETLNLLGIVLTEDQIITISVNYNDGNPPTVITSDVSDELADFNSDKGTPFTLSTTITLSSESDMQGEIGDWITTEEDVTVN